METTSHNNNDNAIFPDAAHDYHGHPRYTRILISLLGLLALSLIVGNLFSLKWAILLIFATAIWKTALVIRNFMHLKYEPLLIYVVIAAVILILFAFFFGVYPDIPAIPLDVTKPH